VIAGYRLEERIGQGGMAVVYRADDDRLGRRVALKLLAPELAVDAAFRARFVRESRATVAVDHPNIVPVYDAGEADGFLFIAMRYVPGGDARSALAGKPWLTPELTCKIISQVAAALDAAHGHGLVHRDVKPANMLLENEHVYLSDFGISRLSVTSHLTASGQLVGTLDYIAPESISGLDLDGRADQYSLACSAFELLTGAPPFHADLGLAVLHSHLTLPPPPVTRTRGDLSPAVDLILAKAMAKAPADRYASCTEFSTDLSKALRTTPGTPDIGTAAARATAAQYASGLPAPPLTAHPVTELARPAVNSFTPPQQFLVPHQTPPPGYPPPGYPPPGWPAMRQPAQNRSTGTSIAIVLGGISIVVIAIAAIFLVTNLRNTPTPTRAPTTPPVVTRSISSGSGAGSGAGSGSGSEAAQAAAINSLLRASVRIFRPLQRLTVDVHDCRNLSYDYSKITRIASERETEIITARNLEVGAIPGGAGLKSELVAAFQTAEQADQSYANWANSQLGGCDPGVNYTSPYFEQAYSFDQQTTSEKDMFRSAWAPIARRYGFVTDPNF
jgi:serine/threonine protein kinase